MAKNIDDIYNHFNDDAKHDNRFVNTLTLAIYNDIQNGCLDMPEYSERALELASAFMILAGNDADLWDIAMSEGFDYEHATDVALFLAARNIWINFKNT